MNKSKARYLDPMQFVKLLAFRAGYEDVREGRPCDYERWENRHLSVYETPVGRDLYSFARRWSAPDPEERPVGLPVLTLDGPPAP